MKKILISFASEDFKYPGRFFRSQDILVQSSKKYVDGYISYRPEHIEEDFCLKNKHIFDQKIGFGYWLWKPYIMYKTLSKINEGDIVVYADCGNSIVNDLTPIFDLLKNDQNGIILFDNRDGSPPGTIWKNNQWTKYDCFKKMNCLEDKYIFGNQVNASYAVYTKNNFTEKFLKEFLDFSTDEEILTDIPNKQGNNFPEFTNHRWDQSILSLLAIKYNITIARDPSEWGKDYITEKYNYPQLFFHHRGFI